MYALAIVENFDQHLFLNLEKKKQICYWTQTHGTVVKTIILCVCFEEKKMIIR